MPSWKAAGKMLRPDFNNYAKRLVKTPKLYFYDTGLACSLLEIQNAEQISTHFLRGGLFENLVINEFIKEAYNKGAEPNLTFWRDSTGNEIDLLENIQKHPYGLCPKCRKVLVKKPGQYGAFVACTGYRKGNPDASRWFYKDIQFFRQVHLAR